MQKLLTWKGDAWPTKEIVRFWRWIPIALRQGSGYRVGLGLRLNWATTLLRMGGCVIRRLKKK